MGPAAAEIYIILSYFPIASTYVVPSQADTSQNRLKNESAGSRRCEGLF